MFYFAKAGKFEIDFVTKINGEITLVEVKATNGNAKSLRTVLENYESYLVDRTIKLTKQNIGLSNKVLTIPYYLAFLVI